jgi:hypothetical protein
MNELNQIEPGVAVIRTELIARLRVLDRQRVDPSGRIDDAELAVLHATKALHAARTATADLVEQKRVHERAAADARASVDRLALREGELLRSPRTEASDAELRDVDLAKRRALHDAEAQDRQVLLFDPLLVSANENERACDGRRRQALLDVARLRLELQAARYQECIARAIAEAFQAFVDEAERFAQVYQATQRRPLVGFDAVAIALRALNVQMQLMAGQGAPILAQNFPVTNETSSVVPAVEELGKGL